MYASSPFGSAPYASPPLEAADPGGPLPEPSGGGNFMLLGVRSLWWALVVMFFI